MKIRRDIREEIIIDNVPVGYVLIDEKNGNVHWAEIYSEYIHTKFEAEILRKFTEKINEYTWEELE